MRPYLVVYDLIARGRGYRRLFDALEPMGLPAHPLDSTWLVKAAGSAADVLDVLRPHVDSNDRLTVAGLAAPDWAAYGLPDPARWRTGQVAA